MNMGGNCRENLKIKKEADRENQGTYSRWGK